MMSTAEYERDGYAAASRSQNNLRILTSRMSRGAGGRHRPRYPDTHRRQVHVGDTLPGITFLLNLAPLPGLSPACGNHNDDPVPSQVAQSLLTNRDTTPPLERVAVSNGPGRYRKGARCRTRRLIVMLVREAIT